MKTELTQGQAIELMMSAIPYPEQIKNIDLKDDAIYFDWRGARYKFEFGWMIVMLSKPPLLEGDSSSMLMGELLKREFLKRS